MSTKSASKSTPKDTTKQAPKKSMKIIKETLKLSDIKATAKTQVRIKLNEEALANYTEAAKGWHDKGADSEFPPLIIFREVIKKEGKEDVVHNWLGDGFTRRTALKAAGYTDAACEIREGNETDAFLFGCNVNSNHGAPLNNKDKKAALLTALENKELVMLSNNALAGKLGFSEFFIRSHRPKNKTPEAVTAISKTGKKTTVKTKGIGKKGGAAKKKGKDKEPPAGDTGTPTGEPGEDLNLNPPGGGDTGAQGGAGGGTSGDAGADKEKRDDETEQKLNKIVGALNAKDAGSGDKLREAINTGALPLSPKAIREWATTSDNRIQQAAPLIIVNRWTPKQAFAFLDKGIEATTKIDHLVNLAVVGRGFTKQKFEGYTILVIEDSKFDVTNNIPEGWYKVYPTGKTPTE